MAICSRCDPGALLCQRRMALEAVVKKGLTAARVKGSKNVFDMLEEQYITATETYKMHFDQSKIQPTTAKPASIIVNCQRRGRW